VFLTNEARELGKEQEWEDDRACPDG